MDKYEYKLKMDQMKAFTAGKDYQAAAEIADSINWHKIKNVNALIKAGEVYEKTGRYEESREILLMAYDRSPIGRMIIYRLAKVAIKMGNYEEAKDYCQEFVTIAPHDNLKYVLRYKISKAEGADSQALIEILEELKEQEYSEKWAYELAYLYHTTGMSEKCIESCDELVLWFGDGPYVERALELKMLYQPLTEQQDEKYRKSRKDNQGIVEVKLEDDVQSGEVINDSVQSPKVSSPERFNTQNLQEELQWGMKKIMEATEKEAVEDGMDNIKKLVEGIPYLQVSEKESFPEETVRLPDIKLVKEQDCATEIETADTDGTAYAAGIKDMVPLTDAGDTVYEAEAERSVYVEEEGAEESDRKETFAADATDIRDMVYAVEPGAEGAESFLKGKADFRNLETEVSVESVKAEVTKSEIEELDCSLKINFQELLLEDYDGQLSLLVPERGHQESQISGQMSIEDVLFEWEKKKSNIRTSLKEKEHHNLESAKATALKEAGRIMMRLADVIQKLDAGIVPEELLGESALPGQSIEGDQAAEVVANMNRMLQKEIERLSSENEQIDARLAVVGSEEVLDEEAVPEVAQKKELDLEEAEMAAVRELLFQEELPKATSTDIWREESEISPLIEAGESEPKAISGDVGEDVHTGTLTLPESLDLEEIILTEAQKTIEAEKIQREEELLMDISLLEDPEDILRESMQRELLLGTEESGKDGFHVVTKLSKEQREEFTYFVPIKGMEEQICQAMTGIARRLNALESASTGNMIIQGGRGSGKTVLATSMVKALQKEAGKPMGRVGKIEASVLNQKDLDGLLKKVAGGCLIIEKVGGISAKAAARLSVLLENDKSGVLVIIEDTRKGIEKALSQDEGFASRFSEKINIPIFTSDELVTFAKSYANELGYTIDEMGILALYNSISSIQKLDQATTLTEVKDIVDEAIGRSEKGRLKKVFSIIASRRFDAEDYVILHEKDFNF